MNYLPDLGTEPKRTDGKSRTSWRRPFMGLISRITLDTGIFRPYNPENAHQIAFNVELVNYRRGMAAGPKKRAG